MLAGFGLLVQMGFHSTKLQLTLATVVLGVGLGACMQPFTIIVQNAVSQRDLGTATASVQFFRNIGGTVGTALLGTILRSRMVTAIRSEERRVGKGGVSWMVVTKRAV